MDPEQHTAALRRAAAAFNAGDTAGYFDLYADDVQVHGFPPGLAPGLDGLRQFYGAFGAAFSDAHFTIEDLVAAGDRAALRYTLRATHTGPFMGGAPTGRRVEVRGMTLLRFEGGRVAERWQHLDDLGFLQQIGALPAPAAA
jgi:steroid delta-isomerase-like uncharacterized protein